MTATSMALYELLTTDAASHALRSLRRALTRPAGQAAARGPWWGRALSLLPDRAPSRRPRPSRHLPANLSDHLLSDIGFSRAEAAGTALVEAGRRL